MYNLPKGLTTMAFNCMLDKCPENNQCPCWWEIPWENEQTGEIKINKGCILSQEMGLPIVQSIVRAAHLSSEHASVARNSFESGFEKLSKMAAEQRRLLE